MLPTFFISLPIMKCLILAAGYATRLYPLTENFPKPLLKVGDKTILDHLIDDIKQNCHITEFIVVTNHKFAPIFVDWAPEGVIVVDDCTSSNDTRLGAVRDIQYAIDSCEIDDDLLVIAGDNVLDFSFARFTDYASKKSSSCIMRYFESDSKRLSKSGVVQIDESDRVISMEEKPSNPKSNWCCPPFYIYARQDVAKVKVAIEDGCAIDAPGSFIDWLCDKSPVYSMEMPGKRYDIGNLESYKQVCDTYKGITEV